QDELVAHELAVVLPQRPGGRAVARVGDVGAGGPLPDVAEELGQPAAGGRRGRPQAPGLQEGPGDRTAGGARLPPRLGREPGAGPAGERVRLVKADVADRVRGGTRRPAVEGEEAPDAPFRAPVKRRFPTPLPEGGPAVGEPQLRPAVAA